MRLKDFSSHTYNFKNSKIKKYKNLRDFQIQDSLSHNLLLHNQ